MRVAITFTPRELEKAQRVQAVLLHLLGSCRVRSSQSNNRCIIYLTTKD